MNTLYTFGCSYTSDFLLDSFGNTPNPASPFLKFHNGILPEIWPVILSKKLNFELKNYGYPGLSNYGIFDRFCDNCYQLKKGDIVILEWTRMQRFRLTQDGKLPTVLPIQSEVQREGSIINPDSIIEMQVNRLEKPWRDEIYSYQNFISEFCKVIDCELYIWAADKDLINSESEEFKKQLNYLVPEANYDMFHYLNEVHSALTMYEETNGFAPDKQHYGGIGHQIVADIFYKEIKKYQTLKK